jgi:hypothetical protein
MLTKKRQEWRLQLQLQTNWHPERQASHVCVSTFSAVCAQVKGFQCVGRGKSINPSAGALERMRKAVQSKLMGMGGDTNSLAFVFR